MKTFEFSPNVINTIIGELQDAEEYIRIALFQIHNREVFNVLNNKLGEGVRIEIITLPYDSINEDVQAEVTSMFQNIERNGARLHFCKWNVGDPERTSTAVGRWYSFHGKFIVTDKSAIALSANFTQAEELDAAIIFKNEIDKIEEYNRKFDELIDIFITENQGYSGTIRQRIADLEDDSSLFELPRVIETETHSSHWIRHYPSALCPVDISVEDKLYLAPFDCRGRNFLMSLISAASDFAYISTESFVGNMLTSKFALRSRQEVKALFARLIIRKEIEVKKFVFDVGKITAALMRIFNRNIVERDDFLSALILYYLSERKHDFNELNEKLNLLNTEIDLRDLLARLSDKNLIEKTDDFYKINLDFMLRGGLINEM